MKITNWCRNLAAALMAGGFIAPAATRASDVNRNLVVNGTFEHVDLSTTGNYNGPRILDWTGPNLFAYSHNGSSSSTGVVPDYAQGSDPPGAGNWYFSSNNTDNSVSQDVRAPGVFYQDINVASGDAGTVIAAGSGRFQLRAYMSSYQDDGDFGNIHVDFRNTQGASLGFIVLSDSDAGPNNVWSLNSTVGVIPVGTETLRISLYGTPFQGGADGFIDNVWLSVSGLPGDYNLNGAVDAADYTVWRDALGSMTVSKADGTGLSGLPDGVVNELDYDFWKAHFGGTAGSGAGYLTPGVSSGANSAGVPEPTSMVLLCIGTTVVMRYFVRME
jgi:hypothetical protein